MKKIVGKMYNFDKLILCSCGSDTVDWYEKGIVKCHKCGKEVKG